MYGMFDSIGLKIYLLGDQIKGYDLISEILGSVFLATVFIVLNGSCLASLYFSQY